MSARPTPFDLVFHGLGPERFPAIRNELERAGRDPAERDGFLLLREVAELLRELRPEEGLGEAMDEFAALVHAAYLFWAEGERVVRVGGEALEKALADRGTDGQTDGRSGASTERPQSGTSELASARRTVCPSYYVQLPAQRIWAEPLVDRPPEPLDGFFARAAEDRLHLVAVFGLHPAREGFTVVEAVGPRPGALARPDHSPLFAPRLEGGAAAGLFSLLGAEELLELGWRIHGLVAGAGGVPEVALA